MSSVYNQGWHRTKSTAETKVISFVFLARSVSSGAVIGRSWNCELLFVDVRFQRSGTQQKSKLVL